MSDNKKLNILSVDVGNTSIHVGLFQGPKLKFKGKIATFAGQNSLKSSLVNISRRVNRLKIKVDAITVCSVVPQINKNLAWNLKLFNTKIIFCGNDLVIPVKNLYKNPKSVGQDRLVNAFAGLSIYGKPLIIIDAGTAVTLDLISKDGAYLGGIIAPGINLSLRALGNNTALLPELSLSGRPKKLKLIGTSTKESMLSGVVLGFSAMLEGLLRDLKPLLGSGVKVILTGGDSKIIYNYLKCAIDIKDEDLTLKGLSLLAAAFLRRTELGGGFVPLKPLRVTSFYSSKKK